MFSAMRFLLGFQVSFFLLYGLASGTAFSFVIDYKVRQAEDRTLAAVFVSMPIEALAEFPI